MAESGLLAIEAAGRALGLSEEMMAKRSRGAIQEESSCPGCTLWIKENLIPSMFLILEVIGLTLSVVENAEAPEWFRFAFEILFVLYALFDPESREEMATLPAVFSGTLRTSGLGHVATIAYIAISGLANGATPVWIGIVTYLLSLRYHKRIKHVVDPGSFQSISDAENAQIFCCRHNAAVRGFCWLAVSAANWSIDDESMEDESRIAFGVTLLICDIIKVIEYVWSEVTQGSVFVTPHSMYCSTWAVARLGNQWDGGTFEHTRIKKQIVLFKPSWQSRTKFEKDIETLSQVNTGALRPRCWAVPFGRQDTETLERGNISLMLPARTFGLKENDDLRMEWKGMLWSRRGELDDAIKGDRAALSSLTWTLHGC